MTDVTIARAAGRQSFGSQLAASARRYADRVAIQLDDVRLTYAQLDQRVTRLARALAERGIGRGDRLAVLMRNRLETVEAYYAGLRLGAIVVPINFRLVPAEVQYLLADSGAAALIVDAADAPTVADLDLPPVVLATEDVPRAESYEAAIAAVGDEPLDIDVDEGEPAFIMYTSGTTGRPKGAVLTHRNLATVILLTSVSSGGVVPEDRTTLLGVPMFHIAGVGNILPRLLTGGRIVVFSSPTFDPVAFADLLEREQVTSCFLVPNQWQTICALPGIKERNLPLRRISWGAAPAQPSLLIALAETFPQAPAYTAFGQTETSATICLLRGEDAVRKLGSVGTPLYGVEARIVDDDLNDVAIGEVGEIVYRGPTVMREYWNNPKATEEAFAGGWFHSGDLCTMDEDGFIWVVDRKKDMIISGGENIYCAEVEAAIDAHAKVAEVAVIGVPHEKWGQTPLAVVTALDPADPPTEAEIIEHCRGLLASYKKPTSIVVIDAMPRTASGKIQKFALRKRFS
ncbi:MAG TPA: AMP-binding protein [Pseudonocardiaceae bacterium]|jgi:acyl-CoA synthetase (AMP-forming)/AMP-acid ligase II